MSGTTRIALAGLLSLAVAACGDDDGGQDAPERNCEEMECYRPYVCVERCDGPVLSSNCCQCPQGQLDRLVDCPRCDPGCRIACEGDECGCECPEVDPEDASAASSSPDGGEDAQ